MHISKNYLAKALKDAAFERFTPVQEAVVPEAIKGRHIVASSATGTGKTHAYLIPIFETLDETRREPQAVIVSPTRELATQVHDFARSIAAYSDMPVDVALYVGGSDREKEMEALRRKQPHIAIGTPGRLHDLALKANLLKIYRARTLVIDEADMALESGFIDSVSGIAATMGEKTQMMAFSATLTPQLRAFLRKVMKSPLQFELDGAAFVRSLNLKHTFIRIDVESQREKKLFALAQGIQPYLALVFTNTKTEAAALAAAFTNKGYEAVALHGDLPSRQRTRIIRQIRQLRYPYVFATDVASRGIDIPGISHIVNYRLPKDMVFFAHRAGRSGRMGMSGAVFTFFTDEDGKAIETIRAWGIEGEGLPRGPRKPKPHPAPKKKQKKGPR